MTQRNPEDKYIRLRPDRTRSRDLKKGLERRLGREFNGRQSRRRDAISDLQDRLDRESDYTSFSVGKGKGSLDVGSGGGNPKVAFAFLVMKQLEAMRQRLLQSGVVSWGLNSQDEINEQVDKFKEKLEEAIQLADRGAVTHEQNPLHARIRRAFVENSIKGMAIELEYALEEEIVESKFEPPSAESQKLIADMRYPIEWHPGTRTLHRTVHLHVGPTNSGKTYHALKRLEAANSGVYAGPLRLLAHEVYTRFNAMGKKCALITGEERRIPEGMIHTMNSCTVEMVPLNLKVDVAVIDEIQMMGDADRGWAWTSAFLGIQAKEVHLCGELRTVELVTKLCKSMGDKLVIHKYERLSPLQMEAKSLNGSLQKLQKGDAIILFSRVAIHAMKRDVERTTGRRCAVVYGGLPPETRAQQAALFNDQDNDYDFLVASDAVGMGLNLSIKRIIFEATSKHDGMTHSRIDDSSIKQIAGRAGRYKTAHEAVTKGRQGLDLVAKKDAPNMGLITTLAAHDLSIVRKAMAAELEPLKAAGIFPPNDLILKFASYFPANTPLSYIMLRLVNIASLSGDFFMCRFKEQIQIADIIQPYKLTNMDRITFMVAPVALREPGFTQILAELAQCVANQTGGELLDLKTFDIDLLNLEIADLGSKAYLKRAECLHKALTTYLWLSYRFAGIFRSQALAFHTKALVEEKIDICLAEVNWTDAQRKTREYLSRRGAQLDDVLDALRDEEAEVEGAALEAVDAAEDSAKAGVVVEEGDQEVFPDEDGSDDKLEDEESPEERFEESFKDDSIFRDEAEAEVDEASLISRQEREFEKLRFDENESSEFSPNEGVDLEDSPASDSAVEPFEIEREVVLPDEGALPEENDKSGNGAEVVLQDDSALPEKVVAESSNSAPNASTPLFPPSTPTETISEARGDSPQP